MATQTIVAGVATFGTPAAGDSFYILDGGQAITGNNDYSAQTESVLMEVSRAFSGQICTAAAPFTTSFSTRVVYAAGAGDMYWSCNSATAGDVTPLVRVIGGGHLHCLSGGTGSITRLEQQSGTVTVAGGATPTVVTARCMGGSMNLLDTGSGPALSALEVIGGSVYNQRPVTGGSGLVDVAGGTLILDSDDASAVNAFTKLRVWGGTVVLLDPGTITDIEWRGGVVDFSALTRPLTITNTAGTGTLINMALPGAKAFAAHPLITFTNALDDDNFLITDKR